VDKALQSARVVIFISNAQVLQFRCARPVEVIPAGVEDPENFLTKKSLYCETPTPFTPFPDRLEDRIKRLDRTIPVKKYDNMVTWLCLGSVCPQNNQAWAVKLFKEFASQRTGVRLLIVGYRQEYRHYAEKVSDLIGDDTRIELHDFTDDVGFYYNCADCLLFPALKSSNATPLVICEVI
jgi:glycosyltransferase involved in cell wall biosynthesis